MSLTLILGSSKLCAAQVWSSSSTGVADNARLG